MDKFEEVLLEHQNDRFLLIDPSPRGKGDKLIQMGIEKKLEEFRIDFTTLEYRKFEGFGIGLAALFLSMRDQRRSAKTDKSSVPSYSTGLFREKARKTVSWLSRKMVMKRISRIADYSVILLRGGSYLNDVWSDYDALENVVSNDCNIIMVAPHSFFFVTDRFQDYINSISQEVYLFCREKYSYHQLSSLSFRKDVHICLSPDAALYLSQDDLLSTNNYSVSNGSYDLICARKDREAIVDWDIKALSQRRSLSRRDGNQRNRKIFFGDLENVADFSTWVDLIKGADRVFTDRLHVAILSAILGKNTFLYPSCYHKIRGVYELSLLKFPNITFIDSHKFEPERFLG